METVIEREPALALVSDAGRLTLGGSRDGDTEVGEEGIVVGEQPVALDSDAIRVVFDEERL